MVGKRHLYPGLVIENLTSGEVRYRVRVEGEPNRRLTISVSPDHFDFTRQYHDARAGYTTRNNAMAKLRETGELRKNISKLLSSSKSRARDRCFEFSINHGHIMELLEKQNCKCAVSDIEFDFRPQANKARRPFSVSIDRVNNAIGYTSENIRLVCAIVNIGRSDWADEDFVLMCKKVADQNP